MHAYRSEAQHQKAIRLLDTVWQECWVWAIQKKGGRFCDPPFPYLRPLPGFAIEAEHAPILSVNQLSGSPVLKALAENKTKA
jgi:hypothetical protein